MKKIIKENRIRGCIKMKVSKRGIAIFFIFVIFILVESISLATYQTTITKEEEKIISIEKMIEKHAILSEEEKETLELINEYRKENGLTELKALDKLQSNAKLKAEDIVNNEYFSHNSPNLGTPFEMLRSNNVEYTIAGENLAGNITPQKAVEAWINSPSHKENILEEKFEYTGICVIESPIYGKVFVQIFVGI